MLALKKNPNERGFILVLVLWTGLALALGVASFLARERGEAYRTATERVLVSAILASDAAWELALADLSRNRNAPRDGRIVEIRTPEDMILRYRITDETGKADLNEANLELLQSLIAAALGDSFRAANLIDRLRAHRENLNAPRLSLESLASLGFDAKARRALSSYVTAFGFSPYVDPAAASPAVLRAVPGIGPTDVKAILRARERGDPLPPLGSAERFLAPGGGPVFGIEATGSRPGGLGYRHAAKVLRIGGGFRGGGGRFVQVGPMKSGVVDR